MIFLLNKSNKFRKQTRCGLVPLGGSPIATTAGLKWNLNNDLLEFGNLVSTCNQLDEKSPDVKIDLSHPALWMQNIF